MRTEPKETSVAAHRAREHIKRLIISRTLQAGDRVPQDEVAEALGVSRIPVREALIALGHEGWVTLETHRGAFVNEISEAAVRDHYELLGLLHGLAARRALASAGDVGAFAARLAAVLGDLDDDEDFRTAGRVALAFNGAVIEASGSHRIASVIGAMSTFLPGNFFATVPGSVATERRGLDAIVEAVAAGDPDRTARAFEAVMSAQGELVVELLHDHGFFAESRPAD